MKTSFISISDYEASIIKLALHFYPGSGVFSKATVPEILKLGSDWSMLLEFFADPCSIDIYPSLDFNSTMLNRLNNSIYLDLSVACIIHISIKVMLDNWPAADYGCPEPSYIALTNLLGKFDDLIECWPEDLKPEVCHETK